MVKEEFTYIMGGWGGFIMKVDTYDVQKKYNNDLKNQQEVDSDDEWQGLIEQTDQEGDPDVALKLLQDVKFKNKLKSRIQTSSAQVLDGMLEGAARLKTVLRVITNLVTLKW
jgi:fused-like protein